MHATEAIRPVTTEATLCCLCPGPVDLRKKCALWRDGRVAHEECYDRSWMSAGVADEIGGAL